jgi:uncharacterized protein
MNCPVCNDKMKEIEKSGVMLDICPGCKGVWLDCGELEKLMEYTAATSASAPLAPQSGSSFAPPPPRQEYREPYRHRDHDDDHGDDHDRHDRRSGQYSGDNRDQYNQGQHGQYPPRKKSWIAEILGSFGGDD